MLNIKSVNSEIYDFLSNLREVNPKLRYAYRKSNYGGRMEQGYWFYGTERYVAVSFWSGMDWQNRTPNIGFFVFDTGESRLEVNVSDADIKHTAVFGRTLLPHLANNDWDPLQDEMVKDGAVKLNYNLMVIEGVAGKIFRVWATFISKRKKKAFWLKAFKYYLLIAFWIGAPIVLTLNAIFFRFTTPRRIRAKKQYYTNLN